MSSLGRPHRKRGRRGDAARTRPTLENIFRFLGEPFDEAVLAYDQVRTPSRDAYKFPQNPEATRPISEASVGRWGRDLSEEDKRLFTSMAGKLLIELGYADSNDWA